MLSNWAHLILDYDFEVIHCTGILHVLPDFLSRLFTKSTINMVESMQSPNAQLKRFIKERFDKVTPTDKEVV